jgi:threonine synthase
MSQYHLRCILCGATYQPDEVDYVCPRHGDDGILDVVYDYERLAAETDPRSLPGDAMWRYRGLLPVQREAPLPPLRIGCTPLVHTTALQADARVAALWVKDETRQPTGSLKDRASAVAVMKAAERSAEVVTTASTGNAAAALAGVAASVGQATVIFVPATAPQAKVAQLLAYGARVLLVDGTYDDAVELCLAAGRRFGWYNRTTGYNPYMSEGKKTVAYEIAEQLGWQAPDVVVVPVGDGCIIGAVHKGFADLVELGWIGSVPRLIGVQAAGSSYLADAWSHGEDVATKPAIAANTVADSIAAGLPRDRLKAMRAVRATDGAFVTVSDDEILAAIPTVAARSGIFLEPAAAAAWAGLVTARDEKFVDSSERVVILATGSGLKDVAAAMRAVASAGVHPTNVTPDLDSVEEALAVPEGLEKARWSVRHALPAAAAREDSAPARTGATPFSTPSPIGDAR